MQGKRKDCVGKLLQSVTFRGLMSRYVACLVSEIKSLQKIRSVI